MRDRGTERLGGSEGAEGESGRTYRLRERRGDNGAMGMHIIDRIRGDLFSLL
jgi:hypothetical protein